MDPLRLMLVTQKGDRPLPDYLEFIERCVRAGVTAVQLREKQMDRSLLYEMGSALKGLLQHFSVPLIINDHLDLCLALDADGLHLGQTDGPVEAARTQCGPDKILGWSVESVAQLEKATALPLTYVGVGPIFKTPNKDALPWGLEELGRVVAVSPFPVVAIGGIDLDHASSVIQTGVCGIAAIGAFHESPYPEEVARTFRTLLERRYHAA